MHWLGLIKGGPGSGNFGHAGRPGQVGGSAPDDTPSGPQKVPGIKDRESSRDLVMIDPDADWKDATGERKVTVFHYSREDRTGTGLSRKFAGTAGAGRERESFEYEDGKLKEGTAPIHAYLYGATRESMIPSNVLHKIETKMTVLDVGSQLWQDVLSESQKEAERTGRPMLAIAREEAVKRGYDALVSQRQGIMQILRDVRPEELSVVGAQKKSGYSPKASPSVKYKVGTPENSESGRDISRRWDVKLHNTATSSPEYELYSLQVLAGKMIDRGILTKADRHAVVGNLVGSDFPDAESVYKKAEELKSKIKSDASDEDRAAVDYWFKHGITAGKSKEELRESVMEQVNDIAKENNKVAIRVPADIVERVLKDGRFKSQFETGSSQGLLNTGARKEFELDAFGVPEDVSPEDRPIYGYMSNSGGNFNNPSLDYYGGVSFILKDEVRDRTTVTFGDSLDTRLPGSKLDDIKLESVQITEPGLITKESFSYVEAQIHGKVSKEDVEEVVLSHRVMRGILNEHKPSGSSEAGDFGGFQLLKLLTNENYKISVEGPINKKTGEPTKIPIDEWADSDAFSEFKGTEEGDAFLAHVEVKYGKKSGSDNRPSWW